MGTIITGKKPTFDTSNHSRMLEAFASGSGADGQTRRNRCAVNIIRSKIVTQYAKLQEKPHPDFLPPNAETMETIATWVVEMGMSRASKSLVDTPAKLNVSRRSMGKEL